MRQNCAVPTASGGPNSFKTVPTVSLKTYAAKRTRMTEYGVDMITSKLVH